MYHYLHPDDVVSARHFGDLCAGLVERGWRVQAMPCNRACRDGAVSYPLRETWQGIDFNRVWRPAFRQNSPLGRLANSAWMVGSWTLRMALERGHRPHVVIIGSDPAFGLLTAPLIKRLCPGVAVAHWAYDLYPEAAIADGLLPRQGRLADTLRLAMGRAYSSCDLLVDIGSCMRRRLQAYRPTARQLTLTPWALCESGEPTTSDREVRRRLFGEAKLGLLYSGNFGRAHAHRPLIELARRLRGTGVVFCFAIRGNRAKDVKDAVSADDTNIRFAGFADEGELEQRLAAADIHLASLHGSWTGVVVPSKFFGSLAAGRPVLFAGSRQSAVANWISRYELGWVLDGEAPSERSLTRLAETLAAFARDPTSLGALQRRCHHVYISEFRRERILDEWHAALGRLLPPGLRGAHAQGRQEDLASDEAQHQRLSAAGG